MRVCFIAPLANFLFEPAAVYGGSEVRAWTLAKGLARVEPFEVSAVVQGKSDQPSIVRDGVLVERCSFGSGLAAPAWPARLRGAILGSRRVDIASVVARIDPAVVCAFGAVAFNAQLADWCRRSGRAFVLFLGSDIDVAGSLDDLAAGRAIADQPPRPDALAALLAADIIIAQTEWQASRVKRETGRMAAVVASPIDAAWDIEDAPASFDVLWIGKTDDIKRPTLALDVARLCPELRFQMVANRTSEGLWSELVSNRPENVTLISHVPYEEVGKLFRASRILLNTSAFEGFPNAFLQAGKYCVPIVSAAVDPDGVLQRHGLGVVAGSDPRQLGTAVRRLASDPDERARMGRALQAYVKSNHSADDCVAALAHHLGQLGMRRSDAARAQVAP